jgi:hypothetical protein
MNWYTSELRLCLYDKRSQRLAWITKQGAGCNSNYLLILGVSRTSLDQTFPRNCNTLQLAKTLGMTWVKEGKR